MFHDSVRLCEARIYGQDSVYEHRVKQFVDELKHDLSLQVFDLPFGSGVSLVQKVNTT